MTQWAAIGRTVQKCKQPMGTLRWDRGKRWYHGNEQSPAAGTETQWCDGRDEGHPKIWVGGIGRCENSHSATAAVGSFGRECQACVAWGKTACEHLYLKNSGNKVRETLAGTDRKRKALCGCWKNAVCADTQLCRHSEPLLCCSHCVASAGPRRKSSRGSQKIV